MIYVRFGGLQRQKCEVQMCVPPLSLTDRLCWAAQRRINATEFASALDHNAAITNIGLLFIAFVGLYFIRNKS